MIFRASNGAEILDKIEIDEEEAINRHNVRLIHHKMY